MITLNDNMSTSARGLPAGWQLALARVVRRRPVWAAFALIDGAPVSIETGDADCLVRMASAAERSVSQRALQRA